MKTNLSSQITLNRVSPRYYRPENAFERSVLTRLEKIPTDIYESAEEGANQIALDIAQFIRDKQKAGRFCVLALAGGNSPRNVYADLVRMHQEEGLSFRNVVIFNLYEYYPLAPNAINSNFNAFFHLLRFLLTPCQQIYFLCREDGGYSHGDGADGGIFNATEHLGSFIAGVVVQQYQTSGRVQA